MRVTVTPGGDITVDADTPADAAAFVRELQTGKPARRGRPKKPKPLELESVEEPLSPPLVDTWNWLVAHDTPEGHSAAECARGLGIALNTALYRLKKLVSKDLAYQPVPGLYRAGTAH